MGMADSVTQREMLIWTDAARLTLMRDVVAQLDDVTVLAVGGPARGAVGDLAEELGVPGFDDLRQMLVEHPAALLLLGCAAAAHPDQITAAIGQGTDVLWVEPPAGIERIAQGPADTDHAGRLTCAPTWRLSPAWRSASEPEQVLGAVQSMSLAALVPDGTQSLPGLLHDAMELIVHLMGEPDAIESALTGALTQTPEQIDGLTGHLTVHLRFGARASAIVHLSDRAGQWSRRLVALGDAGRLILEDAAYQLIDAEGTLVDALAGPPDPLTPAELIARQWACMVSRPVMPEPANAATLHACCEAVLLSCRTGGSESPETFRQMR